MTTCTAPVVPEMPTAPCQFALVLDRDDTDYDEFVAACRPDSPVVWWGSQVGGRAVLYRLGDAGRLDTASHASADAALDRWSQLYPLKLVWL